MGRVYQALDTVANRTVALKILHKEVALDPVSVERFKREFDFSQDWRLLNELGQTLYERAKEERGEERRAAREALLTKARGYFERTLQLEPEDLTAHYNMALLLGEFGRVYFGDLDSVRARTRTVHLLVVEG